VRGKRSMVLQPADIFIFRTAVAIEGPLKTMSEAA